MKCKRGVRAMPFVEITLPNTCEV